MNLLARKLISQDLAAQAIVALEKLIADPKSRINEKMFGICWNLRYLMDKAPGKIFFNPYRIVVGRQNYAYFIVNQLARNWEHHSGRNGHPVQGDCPSENWEGEQLRLRISLMKHLISELKKI
jgi:hypothetical protein